MVFTCFSLDYHFVCMCVYQYKNLSKPLNFLHDTLSDTSVFIIANRSHNLMSLNYISFKWKYSDHFMKREKVASTQLGLDCFARISA